MKTRILLFNVMFGIVMGAFNQNSLELTFTAIDSTDYIQLDSIKVINRTQGGDTLLYYPDTVLALGYLVGIAEADYGNVSFQVFQNYPNPVSDYTTISFYIPEKDMVNMVITNVQGQTIVETKRILDKGYHSYHFAPSNGTLFLFTAQWRGYRRSIKIIKTNFFTSNANSFEYIGIEDNKKYKSLEKIQNFTFDLGDELLYIGYVDTLESVKSDSPEASNTYNLQFAYNIPCIGIPVVLFEGQEYNTVQVFNQCWLKENMNAGTMIPASQEMTDNNIIEKYCYNNEPDSCSVRGGLYQWNELMQYTTQQGSQGICPTGWHIPSIEEYKQLWGSADSQYGYPDPEWNDIGYMGYDADFNLKSMTGWNLNNNGTDKYGFSALPGGSLHPEYGFIHVGDYCLYWTSSDSYTTDEAYFWSIDVVYGGLSRFQYNYQVGFSVRCLKD